MWAAAAGEAQGAAVSAGDSQVWLELGPEAVGRRTSIHVRFRGQQPASEKLVFEPEIHSNDEVDRAQLVLEVFDEGGRLAYKAELVVAIREEVTPCRFEWDAGGAPDGAYRAHFEVWRPPDVSMAARDVLMRKHSGSALGRELDAARGSLDELRGHIGRLEGDCAPHERIQLAVAEDAVVLAREGLDAGEWPYAADQVAYIKRAVESARARLAFAKGAGRWGGPSLRELTIRGGGFSAEGRAVFLTGAVMAGAGAEDMARLARYGLNWAVVHTPVDEAAAPGAFDEVFAEAARRNVSVSCLLFPAGDGGLRKRNSPFVARGVAPEEAAGGALRRAVSVLKGKPMVHSVCLADRPQFVFEGDEARQGFIEYVRAYYPERFGLNQAWRKRLARFEDIDLWPEYGVSVYQYDLQTYLHGLGSRRIAAMARGVEAPAYVRLADDVFEPHATAWGIDHEALGGELPVTGCSTRFDGEGGRVTELSARTPLFYIMLCSMAPDKPLVNAGSVMLDPDGRRDPRSAALIRAMMWEGALAGLDGVAIMGWEAGFEAGRVGRSVLTEPAALEAYAVAHLDINRLGDIVTAFQEAPAEVALLGGISAFIYENGEPFIGSLLRAYEGCSYGGRKIRYLTERQCASGGLEDVKCLVIPQMLTMPDDTFRAVDEYIDGGRLVIRTATPIPYDSRGRSRHSALTYTGRTLLVRGGDRATHYLTAMDAAYGMGMLEETPRTVNGFGYPLEGVKSLSVDYKGDTYVYVVNLRREPVEAYLSVVGAAGRDLIRDRPVVFPRTLEPLDPMLIRLDQPARRDEERAEAVGPAGVASAVVAPVSEGR